MRGPITAAKAHFTERRVVCTMTIRGGGFPFRIIASLRVQWKLRTRHRVSLEEVRECLQNLSGDFLVDLRTEHQTIPPTLWCVAETDSGRLLKVVLVDLSNGAYEIKTAYEPNAEEVRIYDKYS
jgi:hypothetical protein